MTAGKECTYGNGPSVKTASGQPAPRGSFARWKEKPFRSKDYLELLAHYDAELQQTNGRVAVVRRKTGTELPLEEKGRLLIVKLLLDEFGTVGDANMIIQGHKT